MLLWCTKISSAMELPSAGVMKPYPFLLENHLTLPFTFSVMFLGRYDEMTRSLGWDDAGRRVGFLSIVVSYLIIVLAVLTGEPWSLATQNCINLHSTKEWHWLSLKIFEALCTDLLSRHFNLFFFFFLETKIPIWTFSRAVLISNCSTNWLLGQGAAAASEMVGTASSSGDFCGQGWCRVTANRGNVDLHCPRCY